MMNAVSLLSKRISGGSKSDGETKDSSVPYVQAHHIHKRLDSKFDQDKLKAMKWLIAVMTLGVDVSEFFPNVVKNIITENMEVKKLVYMYLIHYAETNADLALLSINTFQKDLSSSNPRVRANAMRAMSSIHLPVVIPLVIIAIQQAVKDNSPYVRKAAACAIPKVYSVDPEQRDELVDLVEQLLRNEDTEVLGCTVFAYSEVCPERWDLIHPHFHKICHLLADFDEWGQTVCLDVLLRYGRSQFSSPFKEHKTVNHNAHHRDESSGGDDDNDEDGVAQRNESRNNDASDLDSFYGRSSVKERASDVLDAHKPNAGSSNNMDENGTHPDDDEEMAEDHRLLLKAAAQLVNSRNSAVITGVAALYMHLAPREEMRVIAKALVRASRHHPSVQYAVLSVITTVAREHPKVFQPYVRDFFVFSSDTVLVKLLKLDVLVLLANEENLSDILREFQFYVHDGNIQFVTSTIKSIGRIASDMPYIAEKCMKGLMSLVTSTHEEVVAESVVVIRQLLQKDSSAHRGVIKQMIKLLDSVSNAKARSAIVWVIGEYRDTVPLLAPDVLRQLAQTFREEHQSVKLQILNMAMKLFLSNPKQTAPLFKYIMDLSKYDMSYDLRDRARFFRTLCFKKKGAEVELSSEFKDVVKMGVVATKPSVVMEHAFKGRDRYYLSSLSHMVNMPVRGYKPLPEFPERSSDSSLRTPFDVSARPRIDEAPLSDNSDSPNRSSRNSNDGGETVAIDDFYNSDNDDDAESSSSSSSSSGDSSSSDSDSDSDSSSSASSSQLGDAHTEDTHNTTADVLAALGDSDEELDLDGFDMTPSQETEKKAKSKLAPSKVSKDAKPSKNESSDDDDDLIDFQGFSNGDDGNATKSSQPQIDLFDSIPQQSVVAANGVPESHGSGSIVDDDDDHHGVGDDDVVVKRPKFGASGQLVSYMNAGGLQIDYKFCRTPSMYSADATAIQLVLENRRDEEITNVCISKTSLEKSNVVRAFDPIASIAAHMTFEAKLHVDLNKSMEVVLELSTDRGVFPLKLEAPVGERIRPLQMSLQEFEKVQKSLQGMEQTEFTLIVPEETAADVDTTIMTNFNVGGLPLVKGEEGDIMRFAGSLIDNTDMTLLMEISRPLNTINGKSKLSIVVNSSDFMFLGHVVKDIKASL